MPCQTVGASLLGSRVRPWHLAFTACSQSSCKRRRSSRVTRCTLVHDSEEQAMQNAMDAEAFRTMDGNEVAPVPEEEAEVDHFGESTTGNLHFVQQVNTNGLVNVLGLNRLDDIVDVPIADLKGAQQTILENMGVSRQYPHGLPHRAIFCNRTLNMRAIQAIGYDMDYTLIHYDVNAWEGKAYTYGLQYLQEIGCPVDGLQFDPTLVTRGLIADQELGNLIKVDRFGYIKRAMHGTRMMTPSEIKDVYGRELVDLHKSRWHFLNTLFSVSEAVMYAQMVDRMDQGALPAQVCPNSYQALYGLVQKALFRTHVEGKLKSEIIKEPERYVELDPDMAATLLDQKEAGKILMLITNSDYEYTDRMMCFAYERFLPEGMRWRDLFDMVIVQARKPDFFTYNMSLYQIVTEDGLMRPCMVAKKGGLFCGGSARMVEKALELEGDDILYVGDHIYTDAALAKLKLRWRTALIVRELEEEIEALAEGRVHRNKLKELMNKKDIIGDLFNQLRLSRQRWLNSRQPLATMDDEEAVNNTVAQLIMIMEQLDELIGPMLEADGAVFSKRWGYLSRAGLNDKSQMTRQIEKYADIFTSRVANFLRYTPYMYFRSPSQSLPHDRHLSSYYLRKFQRSHSRGDGQPGNDDDMDEDLTLLAQAVDVSSDGSGHDS